MIGLFGTLQSLATLRRVLLRLMDDASLSVAQVVTQAVAFLVSQVRPIVYHSLADSDSATDEPAVVCVPLRGAPRWSLDLWTEADKPTGQKCLCLRLLGCHAEVWFHAQAAG